MAGLCRFRADLEPVSFENVTFRALTGEGLRPVAGKSERRYSCEAGASEGAMASKRCRFNMR
jgi:hypothetical protein